MQQTQDSSPSPPTGDTLLQRWLEAKGLTWQTLRECNVGLDITEWNWSQRLYFDYKQLDGNTASRYIDLRAWSQGTNDKWWMAGSQARGAVWTVYSDMYVGYMNRVLVCEGETDAMAARQARAPFNWIFAIPGANTICPELVDRLCQPHLEVTLAFDNDDAGQTARDKLAWWVADRTQVRQLTYPDGLNDLRDVLTHDPQYRYESRTVEQVPRIAPAPALPRGGSTKQYQPLQKDEKPDLNRVWNRLSTRTRSQRTDARGRKIKQAWCLLHDDGEKPGAWVGQERWGCFVCGIESADVYELVAWVRGYAAPGQPLTGDAFLEARAEARRLD